MKNTPDYKIMTRNLFYSNWDDAKNKIQNSAGVILTLGSVEEHGFHLPMGTDTIIAEALAEEICRRQNLYFYPCVTYGQVWSARDFEGTVSISSDCLKEYCVQAAKSIQRAGAKRLFIFSFHNGNHKVITEVLRILKDEDSRPEAYHISLSGIEKNVEDILTTPLWNGKVWHAGELETSLMLHLRPELVHMEKATCEFPEVPKAYALSAVPWKSFLKSGAFGDASSATAEKGGRLYERMCNELSSQIEEVIKAMGN